MFDWYKKWQDVISSLFTRQEVGSSSVVYFDFLVSSDDAGESVRVPSLQRGEDDNLVRGTVRDGELVTEPTEESWKYISLVKTPFTASLSFLPFSGSVSSFLQLAQYQEI